VDLVPAYYEAIDNRAFVRMDLGRWDEAIVDWKASLRVNPDNPVAIFSLGECHLRQGRFARATEAFEECVRRWPDEPLYRQFLERARARKKSW
jgi:tetratricopeptide (TPR) repeat protein